jgi:hypothetical protein
MDFTGENREIGVAQGNNGAVALCKSANFKKASHIYLSLIENLRV